MAAAPRDALPGRVLALAAGIGLLAPDKVVQRLRKRYLRALEAGMPDALDMMVICGQAGLGLEASIERVGIEIHYAHPAVAEELTRTAHEMQVNADTRAALINLGKRTGLESARRLAGVLIQSIQYGTPLTQALRTPRGGAAAGDAGEVRRQGGEAAGAADAADDHLHPALRVPDRGRPGDGRRVPDDGEMTSGTMAKMSTSKGDWMNRYVRFGVLLLLAGCSAGSPPDLRSGVPGVNIADAALDGGMPQTALEVTRSILRSDPRNVGALVRQGAALAQLNQPDAAMEAYRRALAVDPATAAALLGLGRLELSRGSAADAEHSFTKLLTVTPNDRTALNNLGVALDLQGRHEAAQEVYGKVAEHRPERPGGVGQSGAVALAQRPGGPVRGDAARPRLTTRCNATRAPGPGGGAGVVRQPTGG